MAKTIDIQGRHIGSGNPVYIIAEMSGNHNQNFDTAAKIIHEAKAAGADAVKIQTYTADTITIDSKEPYFQIGKGSLWEGKNLYELYKEAFTPWEWQPKLKQIADEIGIPLFSTPFDRSAVDFLERMKVPAYKIASFEAVDHELIRLVSRTGKPVIVSTGMCTLGEIHEAVAVARESGCDQLALLKCTSAYPAPPEEMNLRTIPHLGEAFGVVAGLSDHTLGIAVPVASVAVGAAIIEKHVTLDRSMGGPDAAFSLEPSELKALVDSVRTAEKALGTVSYSLTDKEKDSRRFRRSLFVVKDIQKGEPLTPENVRSIRPGFGLAPKYLPLVLGTRAAESIQRGTPLQWSHLGMSSGFEGFTDSEKP